MSIYNIFINTAANIAKRLHANHKDKAGVSYFDGHLTAVANQGELG